MSGNYNRTFQKRPLPRQRCKHSTHSGRRCHMYKSLGDFCHIHWFAPTPQTVVSGVDGDLGPVGLPQMDEIFQSIYGQEIQQVTFTPAPGSPSSAPLPPVVPSSASSGSPPPPSAASLDQTQNNNPDGTAPRRTIIEID